MRTIIKYIFISVVTNRFLLLAFGNDFPESESDGTHFKMHSGSSPVDEHSRDNIPRSDTWSQGDGAEQISKNHGHDDSESIDSRSKSGWGQETMHTQTDNHHSQTSDHQDGPEEDWESDRRRREDSHSGNPETRARYPRSIKMLKSDHTSGPPSEGRDRGPDINVVHGETTPPPIGGGLSLNGRPSPKSAMNIEGQSQQSTKTLSNTKHKVMESRRRDKIIKGAFYNKGNEDRQSVSHYTKKYKGQKRHGDKRFRTKTYVNGGSKHFKNRYEYIVHDIDGYEADEISVNDLQQHHESSEFSMSGPTSHR
ncbi:unnamed protein product [Heterobilharzia americana]|nr:unnamed protein product [Heterobilharzia americana]CAH8562017.1 unnamed protein product [Heterobilharzia americana]